MAALATVGGNGALFVGEDKTVRLELLTGNPALDNTSVPVDMAGWAMVFDVRSKDTSDDPAILSKTPVVSGAYNAVRATNVQRAFVTLTDTDMDLVREKRYRFSWKRIDPGNETVLAWGNFAPQKATAA